MASLSTRWPLSSPQALLKLYLPLQSPKASSEPSMGMASASFKATSH